VLSLNSFDGAPDTPGVDGRSSSSSFPKYEIQFTVVLSKMADGNLSNNNKSLLSLWLSVKIRPEDDEAVVESVSNHVMTGKLDCS
jgi:hypothetical protein